MTSLQIEFNKLRETQRSNLANESIKAVDAESNRIKANASKIEAELKEMKAPAEIQEILSQVSRNDAQTDVLVKQLSELDAKIANLNADTTLTQFEKDRQQVALTNDLMSLLHRTTGITFPGDMVDTFSDWIGKLLGGGGKAIAGSLIG